MNRTSIIILEDNPDRLREFESAVAQLGPLYRLRSWPDANRLMAECHEVLPDAALISSRWRRVSFVNLQKFTLNGCALAASM